MPDCSSLQKSLAWCQGRPELPGVKRRIYYISKYDILKWPTLPHDANGRLVGSAYQGDFTLRADASWKYIDIIPDKSQLTSEAQGEYPSQTQLNKLVAVHPSVGSEATAAAAYLNNNDNVFLVEDMKGAFRVVGSDKWQTKTTVTQDLGQGAAGSASTTINVEASDECPAPFYAGKIATDDGTINPNGNPNQATGGGNSGGDDNLPSGNQGGSTSTPATYNNTVTINGTSKNVSGGSVVITGPLTSMRFTGSNMDAIFVRKGNDESEANIASNKTSASWSGNISSGTVKVYRWNGDSENPEEIYWFTITVNAASSGSGSGSTSGSGNTSGSATYDSKVIINGSTYSAINNDGRIYINAPMTSLKINGSNIDYIGLKWGSHEEVEATINSAKTTAEWSGEIPVNSTVKVYRGNGNAANPEHAEWLTIYINDPFGGDMN